jgi:hypothetical protein
VFVQGRGSPSGAGPSAEAGDNAAVDGEPYIIKPSDQWGDTSHYGPPRSITTLPSYFSIDWADRQSCEDAYDFDRLDDPDMDESARVAQEKEDSGPVKHTLQQCFDVSACLSHACRMLVERPPRADLQCKRLFVACF